MRAVGDVLPRWRGRPHCRVAELGAGGTGASAGGAAGCGPAGHVASRVVAGDILGVAAGQSASGVGDATRPHRHLTARPRQPILLVGAERLVVAAAAHGSYSAVTQEASQYM